MATTFHTKKASLHGSGDPSGVVAADYLGQVYVDTAGPSFYISIGGMGSTAWKVAGSAGAHDIDGVLHTGVEDTTEDDLISFDTNDLPKDSGDTAVDFMDASEEIQLLAVEDDAVPDVGVTEALCLWKDTNDSNRIFLIFKRDTDDQVAVELT